MYMYLSVTLARLVSQTVRLVVRRHYRSTDLYYVGLCTVVVCVCVCVCLMPLPPPSGRPVKMALLGRVVSQPSQKRPKIPTTGQDGDY